MQRAGQLEDATLFQRSPPSLGASARSAYSTSAGRCRHGIPLHCSKESRTTEDAVRPLQALIIYTDGWATDGQEETGSLKRTGCKGNARRGGDACLLAQDVTTDPVRDRPGADRNRYGQPAPSTRSPAGRLLHATTRPPPPSRTDPSKYRDRIGRPCDDGRNGNSRETVRRRTRCPQPTYMYFGRGRAAGAENTFRVYLRCNVVCGRCC